MKSSFGKGSAGSARRLSRIGIAVWEWFPGYEGLYKVSNLGEVKWCHLIEDGALLPQIPGTG